MIKSVTILFFLLLVSIVFSQENEIEKDSISSTIKNSYIEKHNNQLNISFDVTNDEINYFMPYEDKKAKITSNLKTSYGFVFSHKFLSVRIGIRPGLSDSEKENKGETDFFRFKFKLLFDRWTHRLEYNYTRGFYIENTQEINPITNNSKFHIQFPRLTMNIISGSSKYKFNDNFSMKAIESKTEIQTKSAGTFDLGLTYAFYDVAGTDYVKFNNGEFNQSSVYNDYEGISTILNAGYRYTFVLHKFWFLNAHAEPGIGIEFFKTTFQTNSGSTSQNDIDAFFALKTGAAAGYNGRKYFFGIDYNYSVNSEKYDTNQITLQPVQNGFHFFIGYRFKAPNLVGKPVDFIEDKVPVLKDEN